MHKPHAIHAMSIAKIDFFFVVNVVIALLSSFFLLLQTIHTSINTSGSPLFEIRIRLSQIPLLQSHPNRPNMHQTRLPTALPMIIISANFIILERQPQILLDSPQPKIIKIRNRKRRQQVWLGIMIPRCQHSIILQRLLDLIGFVIPLEFDGGSASHVYFCQTVLVQRGVDLGFGGSRLQFVHDSVSGGFVVCQRRGTGSQHPVVGIGVAPVMIGRAAGVGVVVFMGEGMGIQ
mmetsp:Transcript_30721/g.64126  ORF Transcript_30721/g.64126 Transcript_30721/m.64126 type:complete len:233 (-) Transcript_30721:953-1651(-)